MNNGAKFHAGERAVQQHAGELAIADRNIVVLSDTVIHGARQFIANQSMVVLSSVDANGAVWSSVIFGRPGFLHTDTGRSISIDVPEKDRDIIDPLWTNIKTRPDLGMLFIELGSRRRYRVNGTVQHLDGQGAEVNVHEAYPNCPKYIQRRILRHLGEPVQSPQASEGRAFLGEVERVVNRADTLFVASRHAETGADASHRGGTCGFVHVIDGTTLRIPDYTGNSLFNTLGNFEVDPRAGLCIIDFTNGQMLQLSGTALTLWDEDDPRNETGGTKRFLEFKSNKWILRETPQRMEWEYLDASPFNPAV